MKIRALNTFNHGGIVEAKAGQILEVSDKIGKDLIALGLAKVHTSFKNQSVKRSGKKNK